MLHRGGSQLEPLSQHVSIVSIYENPVGARSDRYPLGGNEFFEILSQFLQRIRMSKKISDTRFTAW